MIGLIGVIGVIGVIGLIGSIGWIGLIGMIDCDLGGTRSGLCLSRLPLTRQQQQQQQQQRQRQRNRRTTVKNCLPNGVDGRAPGRRRGKWGLGWCFGGPVGTEQIRISPRRNVNF